MKDTWEMGGGGKGMADVVGQTNSGEDSAGKWADERKGRED